MDQHANPQRYRFPVLLFLSFLFLFPAIVRAGDSPQRIYLEADSVKIDEKTGISIYQGKVIMKRGLLSIEGDVITAYKEKNKLSKMVATGEPVTFSKKEENEKHSTGQANKIEYDAISEILTLMDKASLHQANNQFSGDLIIYNVANETVLANKGAPQGSRVKVIINPDTQ